MVGLELVDSRCAKDVISVRRPIYGWAGNTALPIRTDTTMNDKPLDDVWSSRDFPALVEVTRRIDEGARAVMVAEVAEVLDWPEDKAQQALGALRDRGLIVPGKEGPGPVAYAVGVTSEAYFLTGLHPDGEDAVTSLVQALQQAAEHVDDPAEKSRLRALADSALGISRHVLGGVLTAVITRQITG